MRTAAAMRGDVRRVGDVGRLERAALEEADDEDVVLGQRPTTGAPTPASHARPVLSRSLARSMASSVDSFELIAHDVVAAVVGGARGGCGS